MRNNVVSMAPRRRESRMRHSPVAATVAEQLWTKCRPDPNSLSLRRRPHLGVKHQFIHGYKLFFYALCDGFGGDGSRFGGGVRERIRISYTNAGKPA